MTGFWHPFRAGGRTLYSHKYSQSWCQHSTAETEAEVAEALAPPPPPQTWVRIPILSHFGLGYQKVVEPLEIARFPHTLGIRGYCLAPGPL
jgi:hypothetical protein